MASTPSASSFDWSDALADFLTWYAGHRAEKTARFYAVQFRQLVRWADANQIPFGGFGKRHMDKYLAERATQVGKTTLHHDGVAAKVFFKWCAKNDYLDRSPLAEYEVRRPPRPPKYMPTEDDLRALLKAALDFWDPAENKNVRYAGTAKRQFHRVRNYAIIVYLVDTACRISEATNLQMGDFQAGERQVTIRQSKGRKPRTLPLRPDTVAAVQAWLKVRDRVMRDAEEDGVWLFVSEFGTKIEESKFLKNVKAYVRFAGLNEKITLHSFRRFSLNRLVKLSPAAAQKMAGHADLNTTMGYAEIDADYLREMHQQADALGSVLNGRRRPMARKRVV